MKKAVKRGLTQRLRERVGMGDSSDSDSDQEDKGSLFTRTRRSSKTKFMSVLRRKDVEDGGEDGSIVKEGADKVTEKSSETAEDSAEQKVSSKPKKITSFQLPRISTGMTSMPALEQKMPADAVLGKAGAEQVCGSCWVDANVADEDIFSFFEDSILRLCLWVSSR